MPRDKSWDWPFLYYAGTVVLKMPEYKFWHTTPRKLHLLLQVHEDLNNITPTSEKGSARPGKQMFIDQIM